MWIEHRRVERVDWFPEPGASGGGEDEPSDRVAQAVGEELVRVVCFELDRTAHSALSEEFPGTDVGSRRIERIDEVSRVEPVVVL